ncbi:7-carboxy-7-deazaguanine synthase QueE [Candidatus Thorarchaeota archaeon]|nr:MAG: 7-carboxy-7-deazaguanine synthase QueE [Candidatus Thorarchaeota archaeon]
MFGMNEIVGLKYFRDAPPNTLTVTSRFYTLQGEGPFRGFPAYFVRLAKCNLACSFCDTYFDSGTVMSYDQILEDCDRGIAEFYEKRNMPVPEWAQGQNRRIVLVITGGEPTLQANLTAFLEQASDVFYHTQIESNGTCPIPLPDETTFVVSPKCLETKIDGVDTAVRYLKPKQAMLDRADCLKFVMCAPEQNQFTPYSEIPQWAHDWTRGMGKPVFVSPMNIYLKEPKRAKELRAWKQGEEITIEERSMVDEVISFWEPGLLDMEKNRRNHEYTADYAMRHGLILNLQIHLLASLP